MHSYNCNNKLWLTASLPGQPWSAGTRISNQSGFCYRSRWWRWNWRQPELSRFSERWKAPVRSPLSAYQQSVFNRTDARHAAQPTVSKHWRQIDADIYTICIMCRVVHSCPSSMATGHQNPCWPRPVNTNTGCKLSKQRDTERTEDAEPARMNYGNHLSPHVYDQMDTTFARVILQYASFSSHTGMVKRKTLRKDKHSSNTHKWKWC